MKCLVTGASGFIGGHLVDRLVLDGHEVVGIYSSSSSLDIEKIAADVTNLDSIVKHFEGVDWVFHTAAKVAVAESMRHPDVYYKVNVLGTLNVIESSRISGVKKIIFPSSASCYGHSTNIPMSEDMDVKIEHPYALSKYLAEQSILHLCNLYNISSVILRVFYGYGSDLRKNHIFYQFINQRNNGKPITVTGDGNQRRDFIYISDVIDAFMLAAKSDISNEILNVGSGVSHNMNYIAKLFSDNIRYIPMPEFEPFGHAQADIHKIKRLLGWEPKVSLEEGIKLILQQHVI